MTVGKTEKTGDGTVGLFRKSDEEKWAEAKLDPSRNARAGSTKGLTPAQLVARQTKASDATNKRRGK